VRCAPSTPLAGECHGESIEVADPDDAVKGCGVAHRDRVCDAECHLAEGSTLSTGASYR
jgi:hypothetical protein